MKCPFWLPKLLKPIYRLRSRMLRGKWERGYSTRFERAIRWLCEWILDRVEMWQARPAFEVLEAHARAAEEIAEKLSALCREFGIDPAAEIRSGDKEGGNG